MRASSTQARRLLAFAAFLGVLAFGMLTVTNPGRAAADLCIGGGCPPHPPHQFFGTVDTGSGATIDGELAPDGTIVRAINEDGEVVGRPGFGGFPQIGDPEVAITDGTWAIRIRDHEFGAIRFTVDGLPARGVFIAQPEDLTEIHLEVFTAREANECFQIASVGDSLHLSDAAASGVSGAADLTWETAFDQACVDVAIDVAPNGDLPTRVGVGVVLHTTTTFRFDGSADGSWGPFTVPAAIPRLCMAPQPIIPVCLTLDVAVTGTIHVDGLVELIVEAAGALEIDCARVGSIDEWECSDFQPAFDIVLHDPMGTKSAGAEAAVIVTPVLTFGYPEAQLAPFFRATLTGTLTYDSMATQDPFGFGVKACVSAGMLFGDPVLENEVDLLRERCLWEESGRFGGPTVLVVTAGGQFIFWSLGDGTMASDWFNTVTIAWLFKTELVSWISYVPALGRTDFALVDGAVLWVVSPIAQELSLRRLTSPRSSHPHRTSVSARPQRKGQRSRPTTSQVEGGVPRHRAHVLDAAAPGSPALKRP